MDFRPDLWFLENLVKRPKQVTDVHALASYAGMAVLDPKMPVEFKVAGPGYVAGNVFGLGLALWWLDPLDKRPYGGFDETWQSGYNPAHEWPSELGEGFESLTPEQPEWAGW